MHVIIHRILQELINGQQMLFKLMLDYVVIVREIFAKCLHLFNLFLIDVLCQLQPLDVTNYAVLTQTGNK